MQVVDVDGVFGDAPADFVGLAIDRATLQAAAGAPDGEGEWVVIAAGDFRKTEPVLTQRRAAEFAEPKDERRV